MLNGNQKELAPRRLDNLRELIRGALVQEEWANPNAEVVASLSISFRSLNSPALTVPLLATLRSIWSMSLRESEPSQITPASTMINFEPKPGMLIFSNAWLPHSTTRHGGETPLRFIHFNIAVRAAAPNPNVEVV